MMKSRVMSPPPPTGAAAPALPAPPTSGARLPLPADTTSTSGVPTAARNGHAPSRGSRPRTRPWPRRGLPGNPSTLLTSPSLLAFPQPRGARSPSFPSFCAEAGRGFGGLSGANLLGGAACPVRVGAGAGGGTRTHTANTGQGILSPLRLPFRHTGRTECAGRCPRGGHCGTPRRFPASRQVASPGRGRRWCA